MIQLADGKGSLFVLFLGDDDAPLDAAWTVHQSTPAAQRGDYEAWGDGDVSFRVVNPALTSMGRQWSMSLHASSELEWGATELASVVVTYGDPELSTDAPVVRAEDHARPFEAWKHAIKVALTRSKHEATIRRPFVSSIEAPLVHMLAHGDVLDGDEILGALTRVSPAYRMGYAAAYVQHHAMNGGLAQLLWNATVGDRAAIVGAGADALRTLGLDEAGALVDEALVRWQAEEEAFDAALALGGIDGFVAYRDRSRVPELDARFLAAARTVPEQLGAFIDAHPEYFVARA
ncbi:MAG TPA: DUF4375 domain-containing protein [Nannocystaceae bacterium]|nr:DUF4375 domain-containing protein [Nannocystaceae bacterium]